MFGSDHKRGIERVDGGHPAGEAEVARVIVRLEVVEFRPPQFDPYPSEQPRLVSGGGPAGRGEVS